VLAVGAENDAFLSDRVILRSRVLIKHRSPLIAVPGRIRHALAIWAEDEAASSDSVVLLPRVAIYDHD
jgi:hypothetical protein